MRYILLLVTLAIIYVVLARSNSTITPAATAVTESMNAANPQASQTAAVPGSPAPAQATNSLKAPLDRTREVLDQVHKQKSQDQY